MTHVDPQDVPICPQRLEECLDVLAAVERLAPDHPDSIAVQRATGKLFKTVKEQRRARRRAQIAENDRGVLAATATAAPGRIDDETAGIPLVSTEPGARAGTLMRARPCYVCKARYTEVDAFYHQLCPSCAASHHERRDLRTDLRGRRALLTGGRAKIGMYIALRLLRDGADTTITTRFPADAVRRFASMPDSAEWLDRLTVVGIDLRDPAQVVELAETVAAAGPLDILINNACQTVRRSPDAYALLTAAEDAPLPAGPRPQLVTLTRGPVAGTSPAARLADRDAADPEPVELTARALRARSAALGGAVAVPDGLAIDAGGLVPDITDINSWTQRVHEVDPIELLEVQLCNVTAPFVLVSRLRPVLAAAASIRRRAYVVNVSAMEGVFARGYKGPGHPHTNMAKAALNMLTRTSAKDLFSEGVLMTSVDTGWITDERPHTTKERLARDGFHAPLDLVDGAARVYDPIVRGEAGEDLHGVFLKDYAVSDW
jgi:NAD(P)-dependent dehydrogenase (short-subunit alcohol dehydrogenase family)